MFIQATTSLNNRYGAHAPMSRIALLLTAVLLTAAVAGCSGKATPPAQSVPTDIEQVPAGSIRGIVVTDSITPIVGADVKLLADGKEQAKKTSASGSFLFTDLKPGNYFVTASKAGYKTIQSSATVTADEANPPVTKVVLPIDLSNTPYAQLTTWKGFLECGFGVLLPENPSPTRGGAVNPCAVSPDSHNTNKVDLSNGMPTFLQAELVWKGTQAASNILAEGILDPNSITPMDFVNVHGESPVILKAPQTLLAKYLGNGTTSALERVFPSGSDGQPATAITNQDFTIYNTMFYGFLPKDTWSFANDGECTTPAQCGA